MIASSFFSDFVKFVQNIYSNNGTIPLHAPVFEGNERAYILDTLETTYVSSIGEYVNDFENRISEFTGARFCVATNSGTAALHVALLLSGVQSEDEVITQPLTFVATCNAIRYCDAHPVFVDVEASTLGLSPVSLEQFLVENAEIRDDGLCWNRQSGRIIRACLPVHNLGHPVRIDEISKICKQYNIELVEDSAESMGSTYRGIHTGRTGNIGVLSFNGNKVITTGGGGALITDDEIIADKARHQTTTSKLPHPWLFLHDEVGYNYRLPNLNAALGCAQMEKLDEYLTRKRVLSEKYRVWCGERDIEFIKEPVNAISNYWLNALLFSDQVQRDSFLKYTNDRGILTRPMWTPMHTLPMYRKCLTCDLSTAENIERRLVNVPSSVI